VPGIVTSEGRVLRCRIRLSEFLQCSEVGRTIVIQQDRCQGNVVLFSWNI